MGLLNGKKNNRAKITEKVEVLRLLYDKIDQRFHEHFKLETIGQAWEDCVYISDDTANEVIENSLNEFKYALAETLDLITKHKGSWLDLEEDKDIDDINKETVEELEKNYNQIRAILSTAQIKYR